MLKEAEALIDKIIDEHIIGAGQAFDKVDSILDEVEKGPGGNIPDGSGPPPHGKGKGPGEGKQTCKEDTPVNESDYKAFFKSELQKQSKPIAQMSDAEKKSFFSSVSKKWKAKKAS